MMLNYLRSGNKFLVKFISIFILGLLTLKTGNLLFSIVPCKCQIVANMALDTEEAENDEHKELDKPYSKLTCLLDSDTTDTLTLEQHRKIKNNRDRILSTTKHFGVIPSPPPDAKTA